MRHVGCAADIDQEWSMRDDARHLSSHRAELSKRVPVYPRKYSEGT